MKNNELSENQRLVKKALYLLVGIPVIIIIILIGMIIYNNFNQKEVNSDSELDNIESSFNEIYLNNIGDLEVYSEEDLTSFLFTDEEISGTFEIKENKLYFIIENNTNLIDVSNVKEIKLTGIDSKILVYILDASGNVYKTFADWNAITVEDDEILGIEDFINQLNTNLKKINVSSVESITAIDLKYSLDSENKEGILVVTLNGNEYVYINEKLTSLSDFVYGDLCDTVWFDKSGNIYNSENENLNVKINIFLSNELDKGYFIDEQNYIYRAENNMVEKLENLKVSRIFFNNDGIVKIVFEDNSIKTIEDMYIY